jgi:hypothetical protein
MKTNNLFDSIYQNNKKLRAQIKAMFEELTMLIDSCDETTFVFATYFLDQILVHANETIEELKDFQRN